MEMDPTGLQRHDEMESKTDPFPSSIHENKPPPSQTKTYHEGRRKPRQSSFVPKPSKHHGSRSSRRGGGERCVAPPHATMDVPFTQQNKHSCQTKSDDNQELRMHAERDGRHPTSVSIEWDGRASNGRITIDDASPTMDRNATSTVRRP